jgi:hypothetical protein
MSNPSYLAPSYLALSRELADMSAALERPLDESQREEAQAVIGWARVALQSGPAWSRIDSAPKDGGPVLGYVRFARGGHVVEMRFDGATGEWVTAPPRRVVLPTHWMPLPKPPV